MTMIATKTMLLMAETIWRFSLQDIESTLRQVWVCDVGGVGDVSDVSE